MVHHRLPALALAPLLAAAGSLLGCTTDDQEAPPPTPNQITRATALFVSPNELLGEIERLAAWKCASGLPTKVVPLGDALAAGVGPDDAARLRDYLRSVWEQGELEYVLLAGDADVMPVRQVHLEVDIETENVYEEADVAAELYFSDLDGDWDPDGDELYGELDDPTDLLPDVAIGRLPVETVDEARAVVDKVLQYEQTPSGDFEHRVLLLAGYAGMGVYGSAGLEGYVATELPGEIEVSRIYEDHQDHDGAVPFTGENFLSALKDGRNVTFMAGHGNENSMGPLGSASVASIDNATRPSIYVTTECLGGRFDYAAGDTSGEVFAKGETGGVAYVGSTHLGVGYPSLSVVMQRLTWCLWDDSPERVRLGQCVQQALREYSFVDWLHTLEHVDRWTNFVTVLLGDPTVAVWPRQPRAVAVAKVDGDDCQWATYQVTTTAGTPAVGATITAYLPERLLLTALTDGAGQATLATTDCSLTQATITVTGRDLVPASP